jgi:hypothetical protein
MLILPQLANTSLSRDNDSVRTQLGSLQGTLDRVMGEREELKRQVGNRESISRMFLNRFHVCFAARLTRERPNFPALGSCFNRNATHAVNSRMKWQVRAVPFDGAPKITNVSTDYGLLLSIVSECRRAMTLVQGCSTLPPSWSARCRCA